MTAEPVFSEVRWSWESSKTDVRVGRIGIKGTTTLAGLIEHLSRVAPGIAPQDIRINFGTAAWNRLATGEELADRAQQQARQRERHEEWERKMYATLREKYGEARFSNTRMP